MSKISKVFWGDATGVHCATIVDDAQAAMTVALGVRPGSGYGVAIVDSDDSPNPPTIRFTLSGPHGALSMADLGLA